MAHKKFHVFTTIFETEATDPDEAFKKWLRALPGMVVIVEEQDPPISVDSSGGRRVLGDYSPDVTEFEQEFGILINEYVLPMDLSGPPETWEAIAE